MDQNGPYFIFERCTNINIFSTNKKKKITDIKIIDILAKWRKIFE